MKLLPPLAFTLTLPLMSAVFGTYSKPSRVESLGFVMITLVVAGFHLMESGSFTAFSWSQDGPGLSGQTEQLSDMEGVEPFDGGTRVELEESESEGVVDGILDELPAGL